MSKLGKSDSPSDVTEALMQFGLSDVEAEVYQVALALGSRPASVIAQKSNLKRGHAYNVLQSLMEKGLIQEFVKNSVKHFTCSPPSSFLGIIERREREIADQKEKFQLLMPQLENLRNPLAGQAKVRFFQGFEALKEIYEDMLRVPNKEILSLVDFKMNWGHLGAEAFPWIKSFIKRREAKGIWWRGICVPSEESDFQIQDRPSSMRQMKMLAGVEIFAEVTIYESKVAFVSTSTELVGVLIENERVAATMRSIYEMLWGILPDYKMGGSEVELEKQRSSKLSANG